MRAIIFQTKIVGVTFLALIITVSTALAEDASKILVRVRAIRASQSINDAGNVKPIASQKIEVDPRLADISVKLRQLHFRNFRLVSNDQVAIPLRKKESINLTEKTVLSLRPLYVDDERIGMWIKWTDRSGQQVLLDTRMHFDSEESMLTGTDSQEDSGLILAIDAKRDGSN